MEDENSEIVNSVEKNAQKSDDRGSRKRMRSRSPSSSSEGSTSSGSEGSSNEERVRKKRTRHVSDAQFNFLSQQVAFLTNMIVQNTGKEAVSTAAAPVISTNNTSTVTDLDLHLPTVNTDKNQVILSDLATTVKDPIFVKSNDQRLEKLTQLQRFNCDDWYAVRFSEAQKKYLTTPGFVELNVNDELKRFEAAATRDDPRMHLLERTFAALTNVILSQKEELQTALQALVDWSSDAKTNLTSASLFDEIQKLFSKQSGYNKVTDELLQIVCGRRADFITLRREAVLRQIPDEFHRDVLQKMPPSSSLLFNADSMQTYLQKIGGAEKLFAQTRPAQPQYKEKFYAQPKPSTSKQSDDNSFRHENPRDKSKRVPRPAFKSNQRKTGHEKRNPKGKKTRSHTHHKNKYRE